MDVGLYKKIKDWLGQPTDTASSSGTAHSKLTQLLAQLGLSTDAASSTGSAHAKLKDIKNYLGTLYPFPEPKYIPFSFYGQISPGVDTWQTVVNISGKSGYLSQAIVTSNSTSHYYIRVTIDGQVVAYMETSTNSDSDLRGPVGLTNVGLLYWLFDGSYIFCYINGNKRGMDSGPFMNVAYPFSNSQTDKVLLLYEPLRWSTSCKIEYKTTATSGTMYVSYVGAVAL